MCVRQGRYVFVGSVVFERGCGDVDDGPKTGDKVVIARFELIVCAFWVRYAVGESVKFKMRDICHAYELSGPKVQSRGGHPPPPPPSCVIEIRHFQNVSKCRILIKMYQKSDILKMFKMSD